MVLMDTTIEVQCLHEEKIGDEYQVFYQVLNEQGQPAIANGVVCGK
jgi:hypothetical protein